MLRSHSLHKVNSTGDFYQSSTTGLCSSTGTLHKFNKKSRKNDILEQYHITIRPKVNKSSSLSDLSSAPSGHRLNFVKGIQKHLDASTRNLILDNCGDTLETNLSRHLINTPYMSWNLRGNKIKKKKQMASDNYALKFANEYYNKYQTEISSGPENTRWEDPTPFAECRWAHPTGLDHHRPAESRCQTIVCSTDDVECEMTSFPFKPTPSGNLKVQSNQVVFQSSTVGVLLANPNQAEVKVKFEGKSGDTGDDNDDSSETVHLKYDKQMNNMNAKQKPQKLMKENGKDLKTLGYMLSESIDWMRVQLPKKQDLYQEFFKRLHNFINTDTIIRIGRNEFHCHQIVLQIYSTFFNNKSSKVIELPDNVVTSATFLTIYDWMIFNSPESNKFLKRDNVLDLFCAAQYLTIKDLEDQCWSFMVNENLFNEDTAFDLFRQARAKGIGPVVDIMVPRVMKFFLPLVASDDYLKLDVDEVITFMNSSNICVTSEIEVLMGGVRWLHGDWSSRCKYTVDVMRCVRFGLISPWQLVDIKRNPENAEILEIVSDPEVQQMVDDGLAYVIVKYWYGNSSSNYYHWIDVLGLTQPAERNWIGEEKNHVTYKDFLVYLDQFAVPREQIYQQMAMMQTPRRSDDSPGSLRGVDKEKLDMHRQKIDFPLPDTLRGFTNKDYPTIADVIQNKLKSDGKSRSTPRSPTRLPTHSPPTRSSPPRSSPPRSSPPRSSPPRSSPPKQSPMRKVNATKNEALAGRIQPVYIQQQVIPKCNADHQQQLLRTSQIFEQPVRDSSEDVDLKNSNNGDAVETTESDREKHVTKHGRKLSVAASFLAAATASMSTKRDPQESSPRRQIAAGPNAETEALDTAANNILTPQISLFNESKEKLGKANMNKLSASILGPTNKNYMTDMSLFNWDRETVLVFGGFDPHTPYGVAGNNGKEIFRFDPLNNVWENVGELPEPRHHHSVAFLRGRVFLVGGADPRTDDLRGTSVVVSTVWSYEPVTKSWYSESGLAVPRKNFALVVHRMALYAIGGQDKKGRVLRSVEKFDMKTSSWSEVRSMNVARMAVASVKHREYIWVAGGMTGEKKKPVCKVVECYSAKTNQWTQIQSLRYPRCFATLFSMNDKLYIIGGAGKMAEKDKTPSSMGTIDVWDWELRRWTPETEMSIPRHGHALAYLGTQLIIIGGVTTIYMRALNNVESYCCERGSWIRGVATLPFPLSGHGAVTLPPASLM